MEVYQGVTFEALRIRVRSGSGNGLRVPASLTPVERIHAAEADRTRKVTMSSMGPGGQLTLNGRHFDIRRVDYTIPMGDTEIWEISNRQMGMMSVPHTMHLHDVQFQVLDVDGKEPPPQLQGWKDTVLVWPGETVRIVARFLDYTGLYMFHCHILEHEDFGMMGQFEVVGAGD